MFLVHRGRLGGGRAGIGKGFLTWYPKDARRVLLSSDQDEREVLLVGALETESVISRLHRFVLLAQAYKANKPPPKQSDPSVEEFTSEFSGTMKYRRTEAEIEVERRHGKVVDVLYRDLKELGLAGRRDQSRDLFTDKEGEPTMLFEVKTSADTQSLYTAVGQLYWHANGEARRVAVLPRPVSETVRAQLGRLKIECLEYAWISGKPKLIELEKLLEAEKPE